MVIPVAVLVLSAFGAFAYGIAVFIHGIDTISWHPFPAGNQVVSHTETSRAVLEAGRRLSVDVKP